MWTVVSMEKGLGNCSWWPSVGRWYASETEYIVHCPFTATNLCHSSSTKWANSLPPKSLAQKGNISTIFALHHYPFRNLLFSTSFQSFIAGEKEAKTERSRIKTVSATWKKRENENKNEPEQVRKWSTKRKWVENLVFHNSVRKW